MLEKSNQESKSTSPFPKKQEKDHNIESLELTITKVRDLTDKQYEARLDDHFASVFISAVMTLIFGAVLVFSPNYLQEKNLDKVFIFLTTATGVVFVNLLQKSDSDL